MSQSNLFGAGDLHRDENGVRLRMDGGGDAWAQEHRDELGSTFNMNDLDAVIGGMAFGLNGQDRLFAEYVPDAWHHRNQIIRRFAVVALFDRKRSTRAIDSPTSLVSTAFYLHLCRALAASQGGLAPRFFYVVGEAAPWLMRELDITTGNIINDGVMVENGRWLKTWDVLGLSGLRAQLRKLVGNA